MLSVVGLGIVAGSALPAARETSLDPLDRPATIFARPDRAVLVSIASAGHRLVAVGESGLIALSDDAGASWHQAVTPVSVTLTAVAFATDHDGWAVGHSGVILVTRDSGQSWQRQLDGRQILARLAAANPKSADETASADAATFVAQMIQDGPDKPLLTLYATDATHVIVCGAYGLILLTSDGGEHWAPRLDSSAMKGGKHFYAVVPTTRGLIFAGETGSLYLSNAMDGALVAIQSPYSGSFFGLVNASPESVIGFGLRGHAVVTDDGGLHWRDAAISASGAINAGRRLRDGRIVLATQTGELWVSQDSGSSFHKGSTFGPAPISDFVETPHGLVVVGPRGVAHVTLP